MKIEEVQKEFKVDRCASPACQESDEIFNMDLDHFINYTPDFKKHMSYILCPKCCVDLEKNNKFFIGLENRVQHAIKGTLGYSLLTRKKQ
jgi:hypothetical protein